MIFFLNSRWRTAAILKIVLAITQQRIAQFQFFTEFRHWDRYPRFAERISCFPNAVWASASRGFSYRLRYTCISQRALTYEALFDRSSTQTAVLKRFTLQILFNNLSSSYIID